MKTTPAELELLKSHFLEEITSSVEIDEIPPTLVITGIKLAPTSSLSHHGQWRKKEQKEFKLSVWVTNNRKQLHLQHL